MEGSFIITVSGPPASGTSTLSEKLSDRLDASVLSGGDLFTDLAEERGMSVKDLSKLAEEDRSIDRTVDDRLKEVISNHPDTEYGDRLVVESRLAGHLADKNTDLAVRLEAPVEVRASRADNRDTSVWDLELREDNEQSRYMDNYSIDVNDLSIYDIVIDTGRFDAETSAEIVMTAFQESSRRVD